ncbi:hypothetical protein BDV34DRAFT_188914 [Aspergillus parasiticus]|uniref:Ankyrin repeat-containing domain protein n=1 Tax=Aspergillus parasiticus TaxID=5067 RepID=A0A5N6DVY7_ASPPA|nr:hypothetical protein BDV34DRAFT_188914 [Aspergillus parasiticus]
MPQSLRGFAAVCRFGSEKAVKTMLFHGVELDSDLEVGERALHIAAYHQQESLVLFLIKHGADAQASSPRYGNPISAVLEGLLEATERIISPLHKLLPRIQWPRCEESNLEADSDAATEESPLSYIPMVGIGQRPPLPTKIALCERIIGILLQAGAGVNVAPRLLGTPLHVAAYLGQVSTVKFPLDHGR